jgi:hypothetical protein
VVCLCGMEAAGPICWKWQQLCDDGGGPYARSLHVRHCLLGLSLLSVICVENDAAVLWPNVCTLHTLKCTGSRHRRHSLCVCMYVSIVCVNVYQLRHSTPMLTRIFIQPQEEERLLVAHLESWVVVSARL